MLFIRSFRDWRTFSLTSKEPNFEDASSSLRTIVGITGAIGGWEGGSAGVGSEKKFFFLFKFFYLKFSYKIKPKDEFLIVFNFFYLDL